MQMLGFTALYMLHEAGVSATLYPTVIVWQWYRNWPITTAHTVDGTVRPCCLALCVRRIFVRMFAFVSLCPVYLSLSACMFVCRSGLQFCNTVGLSHRARIRKVT